MFNDSQKNYYFVDNKKEIDAIMMTLTSAITHRAMTGICRDSIIELITRNFDYKKLDWCEKFMRMKGKIKNL